MQNPFPGGRPGDNNGRGGASGELQNFGFGASMGILSEHLAAEENGRQGRQELRAAAE